MSMSFDRGSWGSYKSLGQVSCFIVHAYYIIMLDISLVHIMFFRWEKVQLDNIITPSIPVCWAHYGMHYGQGGYQLCEEDLFDGM
jgi:hypothetical protein